MRPSREHFRHPIQDQSELMLRDASDQNAARVRSPFLFRSLPLSFLGDQMAKEDRIAAEWSCDTGLAVILSVSKPTSYRVT
jgi:hypothetical protein